MKTYRPGTVQDPALRRELLSIEQAANRADPFAELQELHAAPAKLRTGLLALADGTDWDPGAGAGFYGYYGGTWHKLG